MPRIPKWRKSHPEAPADHTTRERLLDAATEVFARKGFHAAAVDDIVQASGTSKGAFYFYFPSKREIFLNLMDLLARRMAGQVEEAIAREQGAIAKVEAALRAVMEVTGRHRLLARILLVEAVGIGPGFEEKRAEVLERFAGIIKGHLDRALADGDIPPLDTDLAAHAWVGAINQVIIRSLLARDPVPLAQRLPEFRALLLRSIGAKAPKPKGARDGKAP